MNAFFKKSLKVSIASLVIGALLMGAGFAMGGIKAIKTITAPTKISKTFTDISDIEVDTYRNVQIQSGNVQKPTISYYEKSSFLSDIQASKEGKTLSIKNVEKDVEITGLIQVFGYLLNERGRSSDFRQIVITLPKDQGINSLTGFSMWMQLTNVGVENMDYHGHYSEIVNSTISKGKLGGAVSANDSKLKDVKLDLYSDYSQFTNSNGENLTITDHSAGINFSNSTLKNINYSDGSSEEDIKKGAANRDSVDYQNNYYGSEPHVILENVNLLGNNKFMASFFSMDIDLAANSTTSLDIQSLNGDIQVAGQYKDLKKINENAKTSLSHTEKDAKGKLNILNNFGTISIK